MRALRSLVAIAAMAFAPSALAAPAAGETAPAPAKPDKPAKPSPAKPGKGEPAKPLAPGETGSHTGKIPGLGVTMTVRSFALQNGLRVYVLEDHSVPTLSLQLVYNVGSRDEVKGRTGFAHFFEHMMFKGSANIPDGGHFKYVLGTGGQMNAFTSNDFTLYFDVLPSQYLDLGLWLESDRLRSLAITDENFENQRKAVLEEKAMRVDNVPYAKAVLEFFADAWAGTGYGHQSMGTDEDLKAAKTEDVKAFFDKYYVPNNAVMVLVGDVTFDEAKTKVEKYFGDIPRGPDREAFGSVDHTQTKMEKKIPDKLAQQPLYILGWKTVPENHPDRHAVEMLMNILLRGDSSRITKILKDEKKLVIASVPLPSIAGGGRDAGAAFAAFIPVKGAGFDSIKEVVRSEIETLKKKGISAKDLKKAINQVTVDTVEELGTNNGRATQIGVGALFHDDPTWVLTDLQGYRAVKPADIKRVANKYLTDQWMVVEVVPAGQ
jgi:zinc protease